MKPGEPGGALTPRESQVAMLIAKGMPNKEIATELAMSVFTVRKHVSNILAKMDCANRTQVAIALTRGQLL